MREHAPGWMIDELGYAGRENLDAEHVARYDGKEDAGAAAEVALMRSLGMGAESVVLEFGPGTGQFTVEAASFCERLIAVDVSPQMLARLREKLAAREIDNVNTVNAGFLSYEHAAQPVDFVYSRLALHHLPDFWKALALQRIHRALRPGGVLRLSDVVYDFAPEGAEAGIEAWCATGGTDVEDGWAREELEEHVRDEHSTFTWILEEIIRRSGFEIEQARLDDGVMAAYVLRAA